MLAQQAVTDTIVSRQRRRLHARALEVLPTDADPLDIVRHAEQAGTPELGVDAVRSAATRAMKSGHLGRAYRLAAAGGALAPADGELAEVHALSALQTGRRAEARKVALDMLASAAPGDIRTRVQMEWLLTRVAIESGEMDEFERALARLIALTDVAEDEQRVDLLMKIAETTMVASRADALEWADRAFEITTPGTVLHLVASINLGSALTDVPGRREEGRRMLRRAVEAGAVEQDPMSTGRGRSTTCSARSSTPTTRTT